MRTIKPNSDFEIKSNEIGVIMTKKQWKVLDDFRKGKKISKKASY